MPVAFSLTAGVLVATLMTPISLPSIIGQLFNGIDSEALRGRPEFALQFATSDAAKRVNIAACRATGLTGHSRHSGES